MKKLALILSIICTGFLSVLAQETAAAGNAPVIVMPQNGIFGTIGWVELLICFGIILATFVFRKAITYWLFAFLRRLATRTKFDWDDKVLESMEGPVSSLVLVTGIYFALLQVGFDAAPSSRLSQCFNGIVVTIIFWGLLRLMDVVSEVLQDISNNKGHTLGAFIPLINKSARVFVTIIGIAMVLQNFGFELGPVLATLGIGGMALGLAAKDTIANFYGSFELALDRPFKVGDWIQVGSVIDGNVEEIGLRSTKIRTWPKTIVSIPNNVLAKETINNWSRMPKRRVKQIIGVTYDSTPAQMDKLVEDIRKLLRDDEAIDQNFMLVNFTDFGASSLDILVYYFTISTAWLEHMDVRQRINIKIMKAITKRKMAIAFPTQTVHLEGLNLPGDAGPSSPP